jgi:hypothetical protein
VATEASLRVHTRYFLNPTVCDVSTFREALDFEEAIQRAVRKVPPQRVISLSSAANSVASSPVAVLSRASTAEAPGSEVLNVGDHIRYASEVCHAGAVTDSGLETH